MIDSSTANATYFDVYKAAARLGCAPITVRRLVSDKAIEHVRIGAGASGGRIFFTERMLNDFVSRRTVQPMTQAKAA